MGPILFLYYEESLVSSNLNSKLFRFHSAHPKLYTPPIQTCAVCEQIYQIRFTNIHTADAVRFSNPGGQSVMWWA
jgi:hypothetical protein